MVKWPDIAAAAEAEAEAGLEDLLRSIRIASVSSTGGGLRQSADFLAGLLTRDGWRAEVHQFNSNWVVFAETGEGSSTVLLYGHHDVQPPEPLEEWTTPPFEPEIRE